MREKIEELLGRIRPEFDFGSSSSFIADGMLDSFDIVALVSELDGAFSISIDGTDILPENFSSFGAIQSLLDKYRVSV